MNRRLEAKDFNRPLVSVAYWLGRLLLSQALIEARINEWEYIVWSGDRITADEGFTAGQNQFIFLFNFFAIS